MKMSKGTVIFLIIVLLFFFGAGLWVWMAYGGVTAPMPTVVQPAVEETTAETTEMSTEPVTEAPTAEATQETTEATEPPTEAGPAVLALDPYYDSIGPNLEYSRDQFASITFVNSVKDAGADAWDASQAQNGAILAWTAPSQYAEGLLDLYIGSNEPIYAGESLKLWEFVHVQKLTLGGVLNTSETKHFDSAFEYMGMLSPVPLEMDLTGLDVSGAETMAHMFAGCSTLESVNVAGWDVSGVTNCIEMFFGCRNLKQLDISSWKLSSGCRTDRMIHECRSLTNTQEIVSALSLDWQPAPTFNGQKVTELTTEELYYAATRLTSTGPHATETFRGDIGEECPEYNDLDLDHDGLRDCILRSPGSNVKYELHMGNGQILNLEDIQEMTTQYTTFFFQDINGSGKDDILAVSVYHSTAGSFCSFQLYMDVNGTYRHQKMPDAHIYMDDLKNDYVQLSFPYTGYQEIIPFYFTSAMSEYFAEEGGNAFHFYFNKVTNGRTDAYRIQDVIIEGNKLIVMYNYLFKHYASVTRNPTAIIWRIEPNGYMSVERIGTEVVKDYWLQ